MIFGGGFLLAGSVVLFVAFCGGRRGPKPQNFGAAGEIRRAES